MQFNTGFAITLLMAIGNFNIHFANAGNKKKQQIKIAVYVGKRSEQLKRPIKFHIYKTYLCI